MFPEIYVPSTAFQLACSQHKVTSFIDCIAVSYTIYASFDRRHADSAWVGLTDLYKQVNTPDQLKFISTSVIVSWTLVPSGHGVKASAHACTMMYTR